MTQRLLIIGGGIQGILSASAAATTGVRSELIVTDHALGPMGASLYSAGVHLPHGRRNHTRSLTRSAQWPWRPWLRRPSAEASGS